MKQTYFWVALSFIALIIAIIWAWVVDPPFFLFITLPILVLIGTTIYYLCIKSLENMEIGDEDD